jgi:putative transposon-encoded protein
MDDKTKGILSIYTLHIRDIVLASEANVGFSDEVLEFGLSKILENEAKLSTELMLDTLVALAVRYRVTKLGAQARVPDVSFRVN